MVAAEESRIPKGVPHAVTVRSLEGPDVVVERTIDGAAPSPRTGVSITLGARLPAKRWATAAGAADETTDLWVVVQNPGERTASVTLKVLADGAAVQVGNVADVAVQPGERRAFHVNAALKRTTAPILLTSNEPVVVERDLYRLRAAGLGMSAAIPLR